MNSKSVSIIILNYNGISFIENCVDSALQQNGDNYEVIFVDNNSIDGSRELVKKKYGNKLKYVYNSKNLGFSGGMNSGIIASKGEYVLLLNSDLFLEQSYITNAIIQFESYLDNRIGMLAGIIYKQKNENRSNEIDALGLKLLPYHAVVDIRNKDTNQFVFAPSGAAMFLKREMLEKIKLVNGDYLDSTYFAYGEDVEFFLRAQLFGWKCLYAPNIIGWHIRSASFGGKEQYDSKPPAILVNVLRNRYYTIITNYPLSLLFWALPWIIIADIGLLFKHLIKGWSSIIILFKAYFNVLKGLPRLLRKRKWIMSHRSRSAPFQYLRLLFINNPVRIFKSLFNKL